MYLEGSSRFMSLKSGLEIVVERRSAVEEGKYLGKSVTTKNKNKNRQDKNTTPRA